MNRYHILKEWADAYNQTIEMIRGGFKATTYQRDDLYKVTVTLNGQVIYKLEFYEDGNCFRVYNTNFWSYSGPDAKVIVQKHMSFMAILAQVAFL